MSTQTTLAHALFQQAYALHQQGKIQQAKPLYEQAITQSPSLTDAYLLLGVIAQQMRDSPLAIRYFEHAIQQRPKFAVTYCHLGVAQKSLGQFDQALKSYDQAIALDPNLADAFYNRGILKSELRSFASALQDYDAAITLRPNYPEAFCNRGIALRQLNQVSEALSSYDQALSLRPNFADAEYNRGLCLLQLGKFEQAWSAYEWRWQCEGISASKKRRQFSQPMWSGETDLVGKTIYVYSEQGLGDTLQFCRYIPLIKALGAYVIFEVQAPLLQLLQTLKGVDACIVRPEHYPQFDFQIPLMSLPLACKTLDLASIPNDIPYLKADENKLRDWRQTLSAYKGRKIGLVWSGSSNHKNDQQRSIDLATLLAYLPTHEEHIQYVSLQKEYRPQDHQVLQAHPEILDFSDKLHDFSDTAALCQSLDLIVSVDTSVAHLAGGLGKPVLLLLSFNADWRWLLEREDSPWYPSLKLIKQTKIDDWHTSLSKLGAKIECALG
ncbi:tetratricopeptide repeat protein [Undibacterium baiyunense]|uniref:Tetratricopeptide repeat protein n=1 Tax=Undibacterium baiyunense TaxID=2828731 RepID=A0A941I2F8_9BURK|nr:tetratricopeptide repeat protein [Undibacterium baiyunense]MBR7745895.1 tetratricopeptide repeat protein [Undibacterium baiyunense]